MLYFQDSKIKKNLPVEDKRLDKGALNGLRGFFAFHVMTYHACIFFKPHSNELAIDIYGNVDMPLFFLLSGFCLTLAYGKILWKGSTRCCLGCKTVASDGVDDLENQNQQLIIFDSWKFYKKRFIRILPVHYFGIVAGVIVALGFQ